MIKILKCFCWPFESCGRAKLDTQVKSTNCGSNKLSCSKISNEDDISWTKESDHGKVYLQLFTCIRCKTMNFVSQMVKFCDNLTETRVGALQCTWHPSCSTVSHLTTKIIKIKTSNIED